MAQWDEEEHQPEPWTYDDRSILSAGGWRLAKAVLIPDARRIVAAVNDTLGIPTVALEAGFIRDLLELKIWPRPDGRVLSISPAAAADAAEYFLVDPPDGQERFPYDRRSSDRRRGERRRNHFRRE